MYALYFPFKNQLVQEERYFLTFKIKSKLLPLDWFIFFFLSIERGM